MSTFLAHRAFNASTYLLDARLDQGDGDRVAVTGPGGSLTYAELAGYVADLAAGLRSRGVRPEERVVLFMADGPALLGSILAAMRIGAVAVPVSTMLTGGELSGVLRDTRTRILLVSAPFAAAAGEAAAEAPELEHVVLDGDAEFPPPAGVPVHRFEDLLGPRGSGGGFGPYDTWDDSPALWLYTSGTTGAPKGAMHRHANIRHVAETFGRDVLGITAADRCYSVAKLFFAYGIGNSLLFPFTVGATTILDPGRPTPASVTERLLADRPTLFFAVPTFYAALLSADVPREAFESVRLAVSAGEPLPAELYRRFTERFGVELIDGIGSTEALHIFISGRAGEVRPGTTGRPVPGYDVRLVDGDGADVPAGTPGSLLVRGESIATGYWCRTETTRRVFEGQWLHTGDTYVADADGYYTCLGRTNDMLKAGGIWVSPTEVEARLLQHPAVALAAVVGLPDQDGLEKPVACVVLQAGATAEPAELIDFCRTGLAAFKRPREVLIMDELPTTATGKLRRFAVREFAATLLPSPREPTDDDHVGSR
ncbi:benzoate-CoA ligase family protein [Actinomadura sp. HBU206391]|uniref:benzoate-CoA ligase family protein n=1 Tax=Actinomadura sp. HBU206391 TaxID=2731692 RepID=UPI00164FD20C|nr:benzoate-CoA ligase family protein [Actinomadura sp. HBU206391]MBC6461000.1 benzoate-CoA ligase family protein [Actinomadura sp. HBU206391]